MIRRFNNDERGVALVTAVLVSAVVLLVAIASVQLSSHSATSSAFDRKRVQAIDAAEAGINATFYTIGTTPTESLPCTLDADLPTAPLAHYHVEIDYYATYPPTGSPLARPPPGLPAAPPQGATLRSTGTAVLTGSPTAVARSMETQVRLAPIFRGYGQAIFANTNLTMQNNLDVYGDDGSDGDIYTNGNWICNNASYIRGSVFAQGSVTMGNTCTVDVDVQARNAVTMSNSATVNHDVTSSTSSITMTTSTKVYNNARSATTCSGCTTGPGGRVAGTVTTGSPSAPPAVRPFPVVNFDQAAWEAAGYEVRTFGDCASAKTFIDDVGVAKDFVARITATCALVWGNNSTIKVRGNLAIVTNGSITTENKTTWSSMDGVTDTVYFIAPYSVAPPCTGGIHDINMSNNTSFNTIQILVYSPCTVTMQNNNLGQGGQIFGGNVNITNLYSLHFQPILIPGAGDVAGFTMDIAFLREVKNP